MLFSYNNGKSSYLYGMIIKIKLHILKGGLYEVTLCRG